MRLNCASPISANGGGVRPLVRDLLTAINHYDLCITEFIRVVDSLLPPKAFYRLCPELHTQSRTQSGTLVRVQLLGQNPQWLAENAFRAVSLGSWGLILIVVVQSLCRINSKKPPFSNKPIEYKF